jgi:Helix-turn-helix domain
MMLLSRKIRLQLTEDQSQALEFMQGKCRGLYNWWIMRLRSGERWPGWSAAKATLQESKEHDPELALAVQHVTFSASTRVELENGSALGRFFWMVNIDLVEMSYDPRTDPCLLHTRAKNVTIECHGFRVPQLDRGHLFCPPSHGDGGVAGDT